MMSVGDTPQVNVTTSVSIGNRNMEPTSDDTGNTGNTKQLWKFISIDIDFIKSLYGILYAAEVVLSLLGLICVSIPSVDGCLFKYGSGYSYFEFVSSSCFISSMLWYVLYGLMITKKLGFIRWDITEVIWCGFYAIQYLIGSSVMAANACQQGAYKASAAFGFLCMFVIIGHGVMQAKSVWDKRPPPAARSSTYAVDGSQPSDGDYEDSGKY